jgi:hypothetical protein
LCAAVFTDEHIKIVESGMSKKIIHVACPTCASSFIYTMGTTEVGMGVVGFMTDLSAADAIRLRNKSPLSDDDLLACYEIIHNRQQEFIHSLI